MIRILIVHPRRLAAQTAAAVLKDEPDMRVVGVAVDAAGAEARWQPGDLALVSPALPEDGALDLIAALRERDPAAKIVVMGLGASPELIVRYVEAGISGYVLHEESTADLLANIRAAHKDEALVSPEVAGALISRLAQRSAGFQTGANGRWPNGLTPREHEVRTLLEQGLSNRQIAEKLVIEVGTVKNHVHSILKKLDMSSRQDVIKLAASMGQGEEAGL